MKHIKLFENYIKENLNIGVIDDISSRVDTNEFHSWMVDNGWVIGEDEESCIEDFVYEMYDIRIIDDIVEFDTLNNEIIRLIGDNYVKLYHFAPSKYKDDILTNGLKIGVSKTNPYKNSYSGIYLTTHIRGNEIDGYKMNIRNSHNCDPILVTVKMRLNEIEEDVDDKDLSSGKWQFISGDISTDRIVDVEDIW
jgi:hypothetical protein